jgi:hypothetical protein
MCVPFRERSRRQRVLMAIANIALLFGIALPGGMHSMARLHPDVLDAVRGLLLGLSIGMNLMILRLGKRVVNKAS